MEEGVNDWKNAHSKFCWHKKSSIHIEAVSKLLENRNEKDIVKLFGQEESFRSLLKIFSVLKVLTKWKQFVVRLKKRAIFSTFKMFS